MNIANNQPGTVNVKQAPERTADTRIKRFLFLNRAVRQERVKRLNGLYRRKREARANTMMVSVFGFVLLALVALLIFMYNHFQL